MNYGYDGYSDMRTPWCYYPMDYHDRYGYMFPWMEPEYHGGMVYHVMYREIYYKVYPYVCRYVTRWIIPIPLIPARVT